MAAGTTESRGTLTEALAQAEKFLRASPEHAEEQARAILESVPDHPQATFILAIALRRQGKVLDALGVLEKLALAQAQSAPVQFELGTALAEIGETRRAVEVILRGLSLDPRHAQGWRWLGDELTLLGDSQAADRAYARHIQASVRDPSLLEAAAALCENKLGIAERMLRGFLKDHPTDVAAIRMLAETGSRLGRFEDAQNLLARCLELAPSFDAARYNYASVLHRNNKPAEALAQLDMLLSRDPNNPGYRSLKAAALGRVGEYGNAIKTYESLLREYPTQPKAWMSYGHSLKTIGRTEEGIDAYRKAIALMPQLGEAWWSLANLKTFRFADDDVAQMRAQLARSDLDNDNRLHLHFALGKALEDRRDFAESYRHYDAGNALVRASGSYNADEVTDQVRRTRAIFTQAFFAEHEGSGCAAHDPIFIVGLTRAGSTLLEQILASHSAVEGTMELPDLGAIARRLGGKRKRGQPSSYPESLQSLTADTFRELGEEYLSRTRIHRKTGKPLFVDKMPNNWLHVGLIQLILPNARIVDARRHPLACCFSNFKQHFARGQGFTYGLADLGRYYADYVALAAHFDAVLPGRVHRVIYERMVSDPETEVRALLDYCGLPFESACLRFYENERAVRTASSEQVRQPIFTDAVEQWRNYEPWLAELKAALGPVLDTYPEAPGPQA